MRHAEKRFRVTKGKGFRLKDFDPIDTCGLKLDKELPAARASLARER